MLDQSHDTDAVSLVCRHVVPRDIKVIQRRKGEPAFPAPRDGRIGPAKSCRTTLKALLSDFDDSDEEEYHFLENCAPPTPVRKSPGGLKQYLGACKNYNLVPISTFQRQLEGQVVSLKNYSIQGNAAKAIAIALVSNHSVTCVDLEGSYLGLHGIHYIADVLDDSSNITELNLSGNKLMSQGLQVIVDTMRRNRSLRSLDLSDNGFTEKDASCLKDLLLSKCFLRELNVSKNNFEEGGGVLIAQGLAQNTTLKVLNLSWNHLRIKGASAIGYSLTTNTTLEVLDVSWNGFDVPGCHGLGHGLDANTSLRELNISSNRIGPTGLAKILAGLKRNTTLTSLKLAGNPLGSDGALAVLNAAIMSCHIEELDFGNQSVSVEFEDILTKLQADRDMKVRYGKVLCKTKAEVSDDTMYISGNPLLILFEFIRMKKLDILDLFKTMDTDSSHSITWEEFRKGVKKSHIPVRVKDLEPLIKKLDINNDGEINFSELVIAQKAHNMRAEKMLDKGLDVFYDSPIGALHRELHKWSSDTNIYLKRYRLVD